MDRQWEFQSTNGREVTLNEPWMDKPRQGHWYSAALQYLSSELTEARGDALIIGSPEFELRLMEAAGWDCLYIDVRQPPFEVENFMQADASSPLVLDDNTYDLVTSTCVLCHAGTGRYGDEWKMHGDMVMLGAISRVLREGGKAVLMPGPIVSNPTPIMYGREHRIYTLDTLKGMAEYVGLTWESYSIYKPFESKWMDEEGYISTDPTKPDYISVTLRK